MREERASCKTVCPKKEKEKRREREQTRSLLEFLVKAVSLALSHRVVQREQFAKQENYAIVPLN